MSLNQAMLQNTRAEDFLNINAKVETEAAIHDTYKFVENHHQASSNTCEKKKATKNHRQNTT
jgi:hypothetical protein